MTLIRSSKFWPNLHLLAHQKQQVYHVVTAGYILGNVPKSVRRNFATVITTFCGPLGCEHFTFGMAEDRRHQAAVSLPTGLDKVPVISKMLHHMLGVSDRDSPSAINSPELMKPLFLRPIFIVVLRKCVVLSNDVRWWFVAR